jgi:HEPN domain-containing protein
MNVWLVTTGSSDVQLTSNEDWSDWWQEIKKSLYRLRFEPTRAIDDDGEPYHLPARVLSIAYDQLPSRVQPYLSFPLLQNFTQKLKAKEVQLDQIIVLLSDQDNIFPESGRETKRCPYWQDTCQLYPILENYFHVQFPNAIVKPLLLKPQPTQKGLDDWDAVLKLAQQAVGSLKFETEPRAIYVSHQAGTPAISSAVQFCSLAKFGDRVKFLVSNEQDANLTNFVESSAYLRGIEIQQAKKLLQRYDYSGMKEVLQHQIDEANQPKDQPKPEDETLKRIGCLLDISIQWNFAKFEDFAKQLVDYSQDQHLTEQAKAYLEDATQYWWWEAYEAAYLGVVRLEQGNTVEAMFHSFRAVEGLLKKWLYKRSGLRVEDSKAQLLKEVEYTNKRGEKKKTRLANAYGQGLYFALTSVKSTDKNQYVDIWTFGNFVFDRRNELFHQLGGLQDKDAVFAEWKSPDEQLLDEQGWKDRVKNCLNFVSDQKFESIKDASLMVEVHKELERAIADL